MEPTSARRSECDAKQKKVRDMDASIERERLNLFFFPFYFSLLGLNCENIVSQFCSLLSFYFYFLKWHLFRSRIACSLGLNSVLPSTLTFVYVIFLLKSKNAWPLPTCYFHLLVLSNSPPLYAIIYNLLFSLDSISPICWIAGVDFCYRGGVHGI